MIIRQTTAQEAQRVQELFAIAFEQPMEKTEPESEKVRHWAAFTDEGEMMSTFSVTDFQIQFDGHVCKMGGIGGVATLPQYRRQGGIRGCFQAALPHMYENGYDLSYLYPFSTAYYRKFGYENGVRTYMATVRLGLLQDDGFDGFFRLAEETCPMTAEIRALDRHWEEKCNMMVLHSEEDYGWTTEQDPARKQEFTYVVFSAGQPRAYTTFRKADQPDGRNLVCSRFCFLDRAGFRGLMALFRSLSADHRYVKFLLPDVPAMLYRLPEWSLGAAQWTLRPAGMARVVNVRSALEKARYRGSGALTLEVLDGQILQNNGRFHMAFEDGRAVSVTKTEEAPDAVLTIPTFSALIVSVSDWNEAKQWMDGLEVKTENPCLAQLFYRKPMMLTDYF